MPPSWPRLVLPALALALVLVAAWAGVAMAVPRTFEVRLPDGSLTTVTVDAPADQLMEDVEGLPGEPVRELDEPPDARDEDGPGQREHHGSGGRPHPRHAPAADHGERQPRSPSPRHAAPPKRRPHHRDRGRGGRHHSAPTAQPEPSPAPFGTLPSPVPAAPAPPAAALAGFRVPPFLLPIYQAAGLRYGVPWEVLAAINEIESDYGRNPGESSAGAVGWMQFMPATWRQWGVDAGADGQRDPADPVDAIFSAARYLQAAGAATDLRGAVFAYNHAGWYVDSVLLRARLIGAYPPQLVSALTGLAEARFPVAAPAHYATHRTAATVYSKRGAPVVAVADGVVRRLGRSRRDGRYVELEDAYGNRYSYSHLGELARFHPVPRVEVKPRPGHGPGTPVVTPTPAIAPPPRVTSPPPELVKPRLFAHPARRRAQAAGGFEQLLATHGFRAYGAGAVPPLRLDARHAVMKPLRRGSHVLGSTVLGRLRSAGRARMRFQVRPAGERVAPIDPRPVIETWEALARLRFQPSRAASVLLLPQALLERRVLADRRVTVYACGRRDIRAHRVDRRVLATLEYLAESRLDPAVTSLRCGHGLYTSSGNVSEHSEGAAVDVSAVNGVPILGNQQPGGVAERTVRRLMLLQGDARPHQIISLLALGGNSMALADHADHVHVGFHPAGAQAPPAARLGRREWTLLERGLFDIAPPFVPTRPSRWAIGR